MNREEIIRMARECGWSKEYLEIGDERLERFAVLVASAEREECAKIAEIAEPFTCADLIRARGQT